VPLIVTVSLSRTVVAAAIVALNAGFGFIETSTERPALTLAVATALSAFPLGFLVTARSAATGLGACRALGPNPEVGGPAVGGDRERFLANADKRAHFPGGLEIGHRHLVSSVINDVGCPNSPAHGPASRTQREEAN
jgi:hypothetical protein